MYTGPADTGAYKWIRRGEGGRGIGEQEKGKREIREVGRKWKGEGQREREGNH